MARTLFVLGTCGLLLAVATPAAAIEISGSYLEARTCDVYTGPCFANAEVGLTGREAVMAWQVEEGSWQNVDISHLGIVAVLKASDTLGFGGGLVSNPYPIKAVLIVDEKATAAQHKALIDFARQQAGEMLAKVVRVESAPISLDADFVSGRAKLTAGKLAAIETRGLTGLDCVCTNEIVFYPPLCDVENAQPVFTLKHEFKGGGLDSKWTDRETRSAFLATFAY